VSQEVSCHVTMGLFGVEIGLFCIFIGLFRVTISLFSGILGCKISQKSVL